jgi:hypothetical protein
MLKMSTITLFTEMHTTNHVAGVGNRCIKQHLTIRTRVKSNGTQSLLLPEAWVMNKCGENMLNIFERKILRKIFGAVREGDHWRPRYNNELYGLYREQGLVSYIKVGRM